MNPSTESPDYIISVIAGSPEWREIFRRLPAPAVSVPDDENPLAVRIHLTGAEFAELAFFATSEVLASIRKKTTIIHDGNLWAVARSDYRSGQ